MGALLRPACLVALLASIACDSSKPPSSSPPPANAGETITGRERIGWVQAAGESELAGYGYALYVDGTRRVLDSPTCTAAASAGTWNCAAPLPPITPGTHSLELATFVVHGSDTLESPKSAPIRVTVTGSTAPPEGDPPTDRFEVDVDGAPFTLDVLTRTLVSAVDLAAADDGRVFVAERGGELRIVDPRGVVTSGGSLSALERGAGAVRVESVALAPDFAASGIVYAAYVAPEPSAGRGVLRVVRLRERQNRLAQAAIISSHPVPADASAILRAGPDGHLYIGVGAAAPEGTSEAQSLSSAAGKVLRLRTDGRTPAGNPWSSPVFALGHSHPRGLAWELPAGRLWEVEPGDAGGDELNVVRPGANYGWPAVGTAAVHARVMSPERVLAGGTNPSGLIVGHADAGPFRGQLLVASSRRGGAILRFAIDEAGRTHPAGTLLDGALGALGPLALDRQGSIVGLTAPEAGSLLFRLRRAPALTIR